MLSRPICHQYRALLSCKTRLLVLCYSGTTHETSNRLERLSHKQTLSSPDLANILSYAGNNSIFLSVERLKCICDHLGRVSLPDASEKRTALVVSMASCLRNADINGDEATTSEFLRLLALHLSTCSNPLTLRHIRRLLNSTRALRNASVQGCSVVRELTRLIRITSRNQSLDNRGMRLTALDAARMLYPLNHIAGHLVFEEEIDEKEKEMKSASRQLLHEINTLIRCRLTGHIPYLV